MRALLPLSSDDDDVEPATPAGPPPPVQVTHASGVVVTSHAAQGIGFQLWPAAFAAADYAAEQHAQHRGCWRGKRVLELGAGCGLTGLVLASLGAHVTLSDLPCVLPLLEASCCANAALVDAGGGTVRAAPLPWGDVAAAAALGRGWDVLLCADVVYRRDLFSPLCASLQALAGPGTVLLMAHLKRWGSERLFWKELHCAWTPRREVGLAAQPEGRPVRIFECSLRQGLCDDIGAVK